MGRLDRDQEPEELERLEERLRDDRLPDPGDAFFCDLKQRVMHDVAGRDVPRRRLWDRAAAAWSWAVRPVPAAALVAALVLLALGLVWLLGGRPSPERRARISPAAGRSIAARPEKPSRSPGEQWLRRLPAAETVAEADEASLGRLYQMLAQEVVDEGDKGDELAGPELSVEQRLEHLELEELDALYQTLRARVSRPPRPSARKPMRRS